MILLKTSFEKTSALIKEIRADADFLKLVYKRPFLKML